MSVDLTTPEAQIAQNFMERKGYKHLAPGQVIKVEGEDAWYFVYYLPEGTLELEVSWNGNRQEWETWVTAFTLNGHYLD